MHEVAKLTRQLSPEYQVGVVVHNIEVIDLNLVAFYIPIPEFKEEVFPRTRFKEVLPVVASEEDVA